MDTMTPPMGTPVDGCILLILPNAFATGLCDMELSYANPYKVRDATYKEVFAADSTLKTKQPFQKLAKFLLLARIAAMMGGAVE